MVSRSSPRTMPFATYPCAPASSARCMSTSPSWELRTMMRALGNLFLIFLITSKPLMSGNCRSTRATSGRNSKNRSSASLPVATAPANIISGCRLMIAAIPSRTIGWSSTHNTRIFPPSFMNLFRPYLFGNCFQWPCSALPCPTSELEFRSFQLRIAIYLPDANRNVANHHRKRNVPERTNPLLCLRRRDFGWKYYLPRGPLALSSPPIRSYLDVLYLRFPRLCQNHYPELGYGSVGRYNSEEHECCGLLHAEARL